MALACLNYESALGKMPTAAAEPEPGFQSSRGFHIQILPYIEQSGVEQAVKTYDKQRRAQGLNLQQGINDELAGLFLELYWCPSVDHGPNDSSYGTATSAGSSTYFGVMGVGKNGDCLRGHAYEPEGPGYMRDTTHCGAATQDGMIIAYGNVELQSATDGTSQTMMIGERIYELRSYFNGARVIGTDRGGRPTKVCVDAAKNMRYGITTPEETGYYSHSTTSPPGAPKVIPFNDLFWGAEHPGVVHFAFADASVRGVNEETELYVLKNMATRNAGETLEEDRPYDPLCTGKSTL